MSQAFRLMTIVLTAAVWGLPFAGGRAATFTVTTNAGSGAGSLRQAVLDANAQPGPDIISFTVTGTIALSSQVVSADSVYVTDDVSILGPGASLLTIEGGYDQQFFRIFHVTNANVTFAGLTLARGVSFGLPSLQPGLGGAVLNYGTLLLSNCVLRLNTARGASESGQSALGGAVCNFGTLAVVGCIFRDNWALGGEGLRAQAPDFISGPGALGVGGAIFNSGALRVVNSTFAGNVAEGGRGGVDTTFFDVGGTGGNGFGGALASAGPAMVVNCTLATNAARAGLGGPGGVDGPPGVGYAGGLYPTGAVCQVLNTLIALNTANIAANVLGPVTSLGHNLVGVTNNSSGWVASDLKGSAGSPLNPTLGALALHGGATETWFLLDGSPALDAGDNAATNAPYSLVTDQRGRPRLQRVAVDIGAFERDPGSLFIVTNTLPGGVPGSLWTALSNANVNPGADTVLFSIPGPGVQTIAPASPLSVITDPVTLDGYSQPGAAVNTSSTFDNAVLRIQLTLTNVATNVSALRILTNACTIRGMIINGAQGAALLINGGRSNVIAGNFIGTDPTGLLARTNRNGGLFLFSDVGTRVGGTDPADRNVIGGGIGMSGNSGFNRVQGNFIGVGADGLTSLNDFIGINSAGSYGSNVIGGTIPGAGNVISGLRFEGIHLQTTGDVVQANFIGLTAAGVCCQSNRSWGVGIVGRSNLVGGAAAGAGNIISASSVGVAISGGLGGSDNRVEGNVITANHVGVAIFTGTPTPTNNTLTANSISGNIGLGIDLDFDGIAFHPGVVTTNDPAPDADTGPNNLQNFPVIAHAVAGAGGTIQGTLASAANRSFRLEFFGSPAADPSGFGEGQTFLGATNVATDGSGNAGFTFLPPAPLSLGQVVTATATSPNGDTSEFSLARMVTTTPQVAFLSATSGPIGSTLTVTGTNFSSTASNNIVWFGGVRAHVLSASATQLMVSVPPGAGYAPVSVTVGGLTAYSPVPFNPTFASHGGFDTTSFVHEGDLSFSASVGGVALADVDNDGWLDLVVANQGSGNVRVFRNLATPGVLTSNSFAAPVTFSVGGLPNSVSVADIDGDGLLDVVTATSSPAFVSVLRNTSSPGAIAFLPAVLYPVGSGSHVGLVVSDLDGDGRPDIATANSGTNTVSVLRNLSSPGTLTLAAAFDLPIGATPIQLGAADLDADGRLDLVTVNASSAKLSILRNIGSPGSLTPSSFEPKFDLPSLSAPYDLALGDLDGDGRPDLAASISQNLVSVWRNVSSPGSLGTNSFAVRVDYAIASSVAAAGFPWSVGIGDLDGDGRPDLFTANYKSNFVSVLRNTASLGAIDTNSFAPWVGFPTAFGPFTLVAGDLDGDGRPDLVTANTPGNTVSLLRNALQPECLPPPSGLAAWWRGEGNALDSAGTNQATLQNGAGFTAGRSGLAFGFDGTNDHAFIPAAPALDLPGSCSLSLWFKAESLVDGNARSYLYADFGNGGVTSQGSLGLTAGHLYWYQSMTDLAPLEIHGDSLLRTDVWYHAAVVRDESLKAVFLYLNGRRDGAASYPGQSVVALQGRRILGASGPEFLDYFGGAIDEPALFNRALDPAEVFALFAAGSASQCAPGPLLVGVQGGGGVVRLPDRPLYGYGESVTLTATNAPDHRFVQWNDGNTNPVRVVAAGVTPALVALFTNAVPLETLVLKVWEADFGGSAYDIAKTVIRTLDGGYLLAGFSDSPPSGNKTLPLCGLQNFWVVKLDAGGRREWERVLGAFAEQLTAAVQTDDGGYLLGGTSSAAPSPVSGDCGKTAPNRGFADFWVVRLGPDGHRLWDASFGGSNTDELRAIAPAADGGFLLGGRSGSVPGGTKTSPNFGCYDFWIVHIDAAGHPLWDRSYGSSDCDGLESITPTADGGFVLAGTAGPSTGGNKASPGYGDVDFWVIRVDAGGNRIWDRAYGGSGRDSAFTVMATAEGGFVVAGDSESGVGGTKTSPNFESDFWVVRLDRDGHPLWDRAFGGYGDDGAGETAYSLLPMPDGGLLVGGPSITEPGGNKTSPNYGSEDFWTIRLDAQGNRLWERTDGGNGFDRLYRLERAAEGGFLLGGSSSSGIGGTKTTTNFGFEDFWLVNRFERTAPVGTPVILLDGLYSPGGSVTLTGATTVEITTTFSGGHTYYTLDGSDPATGAEYGGPFVVVEPVTIRAVAWPADFAQAVPAAPLNAMVFGAPIIRTQPQTEQVVSGSDALFGVVAEGTAPLRFRWRRDGLPLPGETNGALRLIQVQPAHAGSYDVVLTNDFGAVTSQLAQLVVLVPPTITQPPLDQNPVLGGSATFCVAATGDAPLAYQWRKNGLNIPGANGPCLFLASVQVADGGTYDVVVFNTAGAVTSDPASLTLSGLPTTPVPADFFAGRTTLTGAAGSVAANNLAATQEAGERNHAGKPGGKSVWYTWTAPVPGIATFRTVGSAFDTLLAVYAGTSLALLTPVVSDEDRGGFLTSEVRFNAQAGASYQMAVDGFAGASGGFVLAWETDTAGGALPVITNQPASGTVVAGTNVTFHVGASGGVLAYEWFFGTNVISGATGASYTVTNVQRAHVGAYTVRVSLGDLRVDSEPAILEIGPDPDLRSRDKLQDLFQPTPGDGGLAPVGIGAGRFASPLPAFDGFLPVTAGSIGSEILDNLGAGLSAGEPSHCGVAGGASKWFGLRSEEDGLLGIDTFGSTFDTVLAVYSGPTNYSDPFLFYAGLSPVACNNDATGTNASQVCFRARAGTHYMIAVDGVEGAQGIIPLHWALMPAPPELAASTAKQLVRVESTVALRALPTNAPSNSSFQWQHNGVNLRGATNRLLFLCNLRLAQGGRYSATVDGATRNVVRLVPAALSPRLGPDAASLPFDLLGLASENVTLDLTSDLFRWTPVYTNATPMVPFSHRVNGPGTSSGSALYRLRVLP